MPRLNDDRQSIKDSKDKSHSAYDAMAFLHGAADGEGAAGGLASDGVASGFSTHTLTWSNDGLKRLWCAIFIEDISNFEDCYLDISKVRDGLVSALLSLKDIRIQEVLWLRFEKCLTLRECSDLVFNRSKVVGLGGKLGVSKDRVRQIEAKGLRLMRSPSRTKLFKSLYKDKFIGESYRDLVSKFPTDVGVPQRDYAYAIWGVVI